MLRSPLSEVGFIGVAVRDAHGARRISGSVKQRGLQRRARSGVDVVKRAVLAGERILRACIRVAQRHDRVGDAVECAVEDAADGSRVVDDAVGLAALDDGERRECAQLSITLPAKCVVR